MTSHRTNRRDAHLPTRPDRTRTAAGGAAQASPAPGIGLSGMGAPTLSLFAGCVAGGCADGRGAEASFLDPTGVAVGRNGDLYLTDCGNHTIRKITSAGMVSTLAGTAGCESTADGTGSAARFYFPFGLAIDAQDNLYVSEQAGNTIRKTTSAVWPWPPQARSSSANTATPSGRSPAWAR